MIQIKTAHEIELMRGAGLVVAGAIAAVRAAVGAYLVEAGAYRRYPGLRYQVLLGDDRVSVRLQAPLDLPLTIPGSPERASIGAVGSAVVVPDHLG